MKKFYSKNPFLTVTLSVMLSVLIVVSGVSAATTISTNIVTGGNLTVTGNSTLTGTLGVTGLTTLGNASTTIFSSTGNLMINGYATTTASNGNIATAGTLTVVGTTNLTGLTTLVNASTTAISSTGDIMVGGYATTTGSNGNIATRGTVTIGASGNAITQSLAGTCSLVANYTLTASTSQNFDCAVSNVVSGDIVMVALNPTSTPGYAPFMLTGAKASTTAGFITVSIFNASSTSFVPSAKGFGSSTAYWIIR